MLAIIALTASGVTGNLGVGLVVLLTLAVGVCAGGRVSQALSEESRMQRVTLSLIAGVMASALAAAVAYVVFMVLLAFAFAHSSLTF